MEALAGSAILVLVGISLVVGIRLLVRSLRGGGVPERLLGMMLILTVGVGYPAMIGADRSEGDVARALFLIANLSINLGFAFLFVFTWRVFRVGSGWALALVVVGAASLAANLAFHFVALQARSEVAMGSEVPLESALQAGPVAIGYGWAALESLRYYAMMRRRVRVGLADPVVCNRFLLWGLMSACAFIGVVFNFYAIIQQVNVFETPWVLLGSSATGLGQAGLMLFAFIPPRAYLRWIAGTAPTEGETPDAATA
jgi:hypothetical protein